MGRERRRRKKKSGKTKITTTRMDHNKNSGTEWISSRWENIRVYSREGWTARETTKSTRRCADAHSYAPLHAMRLMNTVHAYARTYRVFILAAAAVAQCVEANERNAKIFNSRIGGWRKAMSAVSPQTIFVCSLLYKYSNMLSVYSKDLFFSLSLLRRIEWKHTHTDTDTVGKQWILEEETKKQNMLCFRFDSHDLCHRIQLDRARAGACTKCVKRHFGVTLSSRKTMFSNISAYLWAHVNFTTISTLAPHHFPHRN